MPKDIVLDVNYKVIEMSRKLKVDTTPYDEFGDESEVIVRTGNRKYTLCRNIVVMGLDSGHVATHRHLIEVRLKNKMGREPGMKYFACKGGNLVYLPSRDALKSWVLKLKSR